MSPKGVGVRPCTAANMQAMIDPLVISHGWTADNKEPGVRGPFGNSAFVDESRDAGHARSRAVARRARGHRLPPRA